MLQRNMTEMNLDNWFPPWFTSLADYPSSQQPSPEREHIVIENIGSNGARKKSPPPQSKMLTPH